MITSADIRRILSSKQNSEPADDFRIIDSWVEYSSSGSDRPVDERKLEYMCYEIEVVNPATGEKEHLFKALQFCRVRRLPKSAKESRSFMDMHTQVLSSVWENGINFVTIIANIMQPVALGLLFLYGVQGIGRNIDEAKANAHKDFIAFTTAIQGTYRVLEMSRITSEESEWLREKMYGMEYITVVRGIPKAHNEGVDVSKSTGASGKPANPDGQGTLEEIIIGMTDYEYVIEILSTPVYTETLQAWSLRTEQDMTDWYGQLQGTKGLSFNLSIPMMYMANQSASNGWSQAYTDAESVTYSEGTSFTTSYGENVGEALSESFGTSIGHSDGISSSESVSFSNTVTDGETLGHTVGTTIGETVGTTDGTTIGRSLGESVGHSIGNSTTHTVGTSLGESFGESHTESTTIGQTHTEGTTIGNTHSVSSSESESFGDSTSHSIGSSESWSTSNGEGHSTGTSEGNSTSTSVSENFGSSTSESVSQSTSNSVSDSTSTSQSIGTSQSASQGNSSGVSIGKTHSDSESNSYSHSSSESNSVSVGHSSSTSNSTSIGQSTSHSVSDSQSQGTNHSTSTGVNDSTSNNWNHGDSQNTGLSYNNGTSNSSNSSSTHTDTSSTSQQQSGSTTNGSTTGQTAGNNNTQSNSHNSGGGVGASLLGISGNVSQSDGQSNTAGKTDSTSQSNTSSIGNTYGNGLSNGTSDGTSNGTGASSSSSTGGSYSKGTSDSYGGGTSHGTSSGESNGTSAGTSHGVSNGSGTSINQGYTTGTSNSVSNSNGHTEGFSSGKSYGSTDSYSQTTSNGVSASTGKTLSETNGSSTGHSEGTTESVSVSNGTGTSYGKGSSIGYGTNSGTSESFSTNSSSSLGGGKSLSDGWGTSHSYGFSNGVSDAESVSHSVSDSTSISKGVSDGVTHTTSQTNSVSDGVSKSYTDSFSNSKTDSVSSSHSNSVSHSVSNSNSDSVSNSHSISNGTSRGTSHGTSSSDSTSESTSHGTTTSKGSSKSVSNGNSNSTSNGTSRGESIGTSGAYATGTASSMGLGPSIGYSKSYQWVDQQVKDIIELLEFQNQRIKKALRGEGAMYTYVYIACPSVDALSAAMAVAKSAWQNEYALVSPIQVLNLSESEQNHLLYHFAGFSTDVSRELVAGVQEYKYATVLLPGELTAYTHLPRISEGGIYANVEDVPKFAVPSMLKGEIYLGTILSAERYSLNNGYGTPFDYRIDESELMHGIFAGSSRSGKTVTAVRFAAELAQVRRKKTGKRLRIVCMDPKTDWRVLARYVEPERFRFYSLGNINFHPIKLNPWKIPKGVWPQIWIDGIIDIYCRAYGLLERGKQMMGETIYALYEEAGVFAACDKANWQELVPELSRHVTFAKIYDKMMSIKGRLEDPNNPKGRAGNDTRDAYARLLDRLQAFSREFSIERRLFSSEDGMGVDDLVGADDVTVLESSGLETTFSNFIFGVITSGFYKCAKAHEKGFLSKDQYETVLFIEEANKVLIGNDTAGTGGGNAIGLSGQSEFEEILDQSAGWGLFVFAITQKIADMPSSVVANSGMIFAGKQGRTDDTTTVIRKIAREERYEDRDMVKWFPRAPIGWIVCQSARGFDFKAAEPVLVKVAPLNNNVPTNDELDEILAKKRAMEVIATA